MNKNKLICITDLIKERRWSRKLIREFLGEPDKFLPNPYYPGSHPVKLYKLSRVRKSEKKDTFLARMIQIEKQRKKAKQRLHGGGY